MAKAAIFCRYFLGAVFLIFGSNGLMMIFTGAGFIPMPEPTPEMAQVMGALFGMVYLMPLVKLLQVISGLLLLSNKYVNLAIVFLFPIAINILGVHLFIDPAGAPMAVAIVVALIVLLKSRWADFRVLVKK